ncbi:MAG: ABC transporter ATP-binding protein [Lacisediminihabitans sp.]
MSDSAPLLSVTGLDVELGSGARASRVLNNVSLEVARGSAVGIVGESGSGKSTLAKTIVGMHRPQRGIIDFAGTDLTSRSPSRLRSVMRRIQYIPQDPYSSLDPRRTIGQTLAEAIDPRWPRVRTHRPLIAEALLAVALTEDVIDRYPHEFSGGQRQRIAIARALATKPEIIIADEITSALDVSTQAEILTLLQRLRGDLGLTMLFISHNLAVVRVLCDQIVVLLQGDVVESGATVDVFRSPKSEYTRRLIESVPGGPAFSLAEVSPA